VYLPPVLIIIYFIKYKHTEASVISDSKAQRRNRQRNNGVVEDLLIFNRKFILFTDENLGFCAEQTTSYKAYLSIEFILRGSAVSMED
jgi:hypothetical protein